MNQTRPNKSSAGEVLLSPHRMQRSPQRRSGPAADVAGGVPAAMQGILRGDLDPDPHKEPRGLSKLVMDLRNG